MSSHRPSTPGGSPPSVTELWVGFLGCTHTDRSRAFEELLAAHPERADELRELYAANALVEQHLNVFGRGRAQEQAPGFAAGARVGDRIGDFRLLSRLASGGQGEVWEAEQVSLGRRVALKLVLPGRVDEKTLALFAREARAGGRLAHPGIVQVHGFGKDDGQHWIAQELVPGAWTLRDSLDKLRREENWPEDYPSYVARFVAELADALQAAHDAGVIHRDVKPRNVLITPDDHPKLTDFGLARIADETALSMTGDFAGTWHYMSPEQVSAKRIGIDHRTDVFSLGVVLFEMLGLERPFDGDTTHQIAEKILLHEAPDLRKIRSRVPRDLAVICAKALEKPMAARFQSMAEFAADLRRFLHDEPIHAKPPTSLERARKWVRRHPTASVAFLTVASISIVVSTLALRIARHNRELERRRSELSQVNRDLDDTTRRLAETAQLIEERRQAAQADTRAAQLSEREAQRSLDEVLRLSLGQDLETLLGDVDALWPPWPRNVQPMEEWIARAEALVRERAALQGHLEELDKSEGADHADDDPRRNWWRNQLGGLIEGLGALLDEDTGLLSEAGVDPEHGWSVPRRLRLAERLGEGFAPGGPFQARWEEAAPAIAATYPGLELPPQMGLVPIGPDPASGLWEFWHVASGAEPPRDEEGRLQLEESSGVVLVLLAGGRFWMGADSDPATPHNFDPQAGDDEGPVHEVELSPFFLSKYELTQGQWRRLAGQNLSFYGPDTKILDHQHDLTHPVERVSWEECVRLMDRFGLALPTEAQWEYGARGGRETPWWTGAERESLVSLHAANLADQTAAEAGAPWPAIQDWPELKDGYAVHGPVNAYAPNPFGLYNVHGNVWEWCMDSYADGFYARAPREDPVNLAEASADRVFRGGSFYSRASDARSAIRNFNPPRDLGDSLGLRPAQGITTSSFTSSPSPDPDSPDR